MTQKDRISSRMMEKFYIGSIKTVGSRIDVFICCYHGKCAVIISYQNILLWLKYITALIWV